MASVFDTYLDAYGYAARQGLNMNQAYQYASNSARQQSTAHWTRSEVRRIREIYPQRTPFIDYMYNAYLLGHFAGVDIAVDEDDFIHLRTESEKSINLNIYE